MDFQLVDLPEFYIAGVGVRTTNANGQSMADIGALWNRFRRETRELNIPLKQGEDVLCLYTDYENGSEGLYTTLIGWKVRELPMHWGPGLEGRSIPAARYRRYISRGKLPNCVLDTWMKIWSDPLERRYLADFDLYKPATYNADHAEVETYVSIW